MSVGGSMFSCHVCFNFMVVSKSSINYAGFSALKCVVSVIIKDV